MLLLEFQAQISPIIFAFIKVEFLNQPFLVLIENMVVFVFECVLKIYFTCFGPYSFNCCLFYLVLFFIFLKFHPP